MLCFTSWNICFKIADIFTCFNMTPRELATTPFPIPLMTPPVIKQNVNKKLQVKWQYYEIVHSISISIISYILYLKSYYAKQRDYVNIYFQEYTYQLPKYTSSCSNSWIWTNYCLAKLMIWTKDRFLIGSLLWLVASLEKMGSLTSLTSILVCGPADQFKKDLDKRTLETCKSQKIVCYCYVLILLYMVTVREKKPHVPFVSIYMNSLQ